MSKQLLKLFKRSKIEKSFLELLKHDTIKVISFDIFSTLAFRDVSFPEDIFLKMGKHKYIRKIFNSPENFKHFRIEAEKKARDTHRSVEDIKFEWIYNQLDLTEVQRKKIMHIELEIENESLYINKQIDRWIKLSHKNNKKIVLISDIYLKNKEIEKIILKKVQNRKYISKVYLSSEYGKSKKKSGLYKIVMHDLDVEPNEILHIGDNFYSDIKNAKDLRLCSLYYNIRDYLKDFSNIEQQYIKADLGKIKNIRNLSLLLNPYENDEEQFFFELASTVYGPILWEFVRWLNDLAQQKGVSQINFVTREGNIFKKYFDLVYGDAYKLNLLYASRKSTYLSSIDKDTFSIENFPFYKHRIFTIEDLYKLFNIDIKNEILIANKNLSCEDAKKIIDESDKSLFDLLCEDFFNQKDKVQKSMVEEQSNIYQYMTQLNIQKDSLIVDFGGTGTILKRLSKIFPMNNNVLFYMHEEGYENMLPNMTFPFLSLTHTTQSAIRLLKRTPEFTEILFNGLEKTAIGYKKNEKDVKALTDFPYSKEYKKCLKKKIKAFHKGLDAYFLTCMEYKFSKTIEKDTLSLLLARCIDVPNEKEVKYLGSLQTDEGKGSSFIKQLVSEETRMIIQKEGIESSYYNFMKNKSFKRKEIHWIQGNISSINGEYIYQMKGLDKLNATDIAVKKVIHLLDTLEHITKINVYGAGVFFKKLKEYLDLRNIEVKNLIDSRANLSTFTFEGYGVKSLDEILEEFNELPIVIASAEFSNEIYETIKSKVKEFSLEARVICNSKGVTYINEKED